ncbi:MAG: hypothetical protein QQN63_11535, partial [Nitrosopumilus sp.]
LFPNAGGRKDLNRADKFTRIYRRVTTEMENIHKARQVEITPETLVDGILEYIGRTDRIYEEAWRDHQDAEDYDTKIRALTLAQEAAKNKARALGIPVDGRTVKTTQRVIASADSPRELADLVNGVQKQIDRTGKATLELEQTTVIEGASIEDRVANGTDMATGSTES